MVLVLDTEVSENSFKVGSDTQVVVESGCLKLVSNESLLLELPNLWLRDNCSCDDCRVSKTQEKSFILSNIAADIYPDKVSIVDLSLIHI